MPGFYVITALLFFTRLKGANCTSTQLTINSSEENHSNKQCRGDYIVSLTIHSADVKMTPYCIVINKPACTSYAYSSLQKCPFYIRWGVAGIRGEFHCRGCGSKSRCNKEGERDEEPGNCSLFNFPRERGANREGTLFFQNNLCLSLLLCVCVCVCSIQSEMNKL